jgi:hypothetical protein
MAGTVIPLRQRRSRRRHNASNFRPFQAGFRMKTSLCFFFSLLAGCMTRGSNPVADMPAWMGGLPADAPPRPGTPAYEAWQAERAEEPARPKRQ